MEINKVDFFKEFLQLLKVTFSLSNKDGLLVSPVINIKTMKSMYTWEQGNIVKTDELKAYNLARKLKIVLNRILDSEQDEKIALGITNDQWFAEN